MLKRLGVLLAVAWLAAAGAAEAQQATLVEGELTIMVEGQPDAVYKPGQSWMIPAATPHDAKAGSAGAKVIAVYTVEKGKPLASPAN